MQDLALTQGMTSPFPSASPCEHRAVSREGRIICKKIVEGDNEITPNLCRTCPFKAVNCAHLRFSLRQITPSRLVVRFNGRTEIWDDDPPEICLEQAACAIKVAPVDHPRSCAGCPLRQPLRPAAADGVRRLRKPQPGRMGKVVPFPSREVAALAG